MAALRSIYEEKEGWYREESESVATELGRVRVELQKAQTQRRQSQEEARAATLAANALKRRFGRLEGRYEALAQQVAAEMRWVEELLRSCSTEAEERSTGLA